MLTAEEYHDLKIIVLMLVKCDTHGEEDECNAACHAVDRVLEEVWKFSAMAKLAVMAKRPARYAMDGKRPVDECGQVKCETSTCLVWHNPEWSDGTPRYGCSAHAVENAR